MKSPKATFTLKGLLTLAILAIVTATLFFLNKREPSSTTTSDFTSAQAEILSNAFVNNANAGSASFTASLQASTSFSATGVVSWESQEGYMQATQDNEVLYFFWKENSVFYKTSADGPWVRFTANNVGEDLMWLITAVSSMQDPMHRTLADFQSLGFTQSSLEGSVTLFVSPVVKLGVSDEGFLVSMTALVPSGVGQATISLDKLGTAIVPNAQI